MTELERQLTAALERLSAQYAREQQRQTEQVEAVQQQQSEQVEALQQRIEACRRQIAQLAEHVTRLGADYRMLAATLRGPWN